MYSVVIVHQYVVIAHCIQYIDICLYVNAECQQSRTLWTSTYSWLQNLIRKLFLLLESGAPRPYILLWL